MKKKLVWLVMSCVMVLSLVLVSCGEEEEEEEEEVIIPPGEEEEVKPPPAEEEEVKPPTGGNWWDYHGTPEYGGKLTLRQAGDPYVWDPYRGYAGSTGPNLYMEHLSSMDWVKDRNIWDPDQLWSPTGLATAWEIVDGYHQIFHIRQGVHWHDRDPVYGRELDAYDVAWSYNRLTGKGSGFTEPTPYMMIPPWQEIDSIEAIDKWTMEVYYNKPNDPTLLTNFGIFAIFCRDVVEKYGDLTDWKNAVGTGPFTLDDFVSGASITLSKNPNYWGWDERHPENSIPYIDDLKILIVPDLSTALAALRTGKIDIIENIPWEQAVKMTETNPELESYMVLAMNYGLKPRIDAEPFTDIRVRQAMNMAIDRKTIAETYYGGLVEGKPYGIMGPTPEFGDYYTPFEEWPSELQAEYKYDPAGAKALLAEAGYPNGFKTNLIVSTATDMDIVQVFQYYLAEVGIEMEIKPVEATTFFTYVNIQHKHDQMFWGSIDSFDPRVAVMGYEAPNASLIDDPVFNAMALDFRINIDEAGVLEPISERVIAGSEIDMYVMSHHWAVPGIPSFTFRLWQPWLKGYSHEQLWRWPASQYARWWINHDVKKAMGYE